MATYIQIATVTVGAGGAANIDFSSIPSTYTDLLLKVSARSANASVADNLLVAFNTSSSTFTVRRLIGNGSAANSYSGSTNYMSEAVANSATSSTFSNQELYIPNYAGSTNKSYSVDGVTENNATTAYITLTAGLWATTSAINRITLTTETASNFQQYSTATLYGISKS